MLDLLLKYTKTSLHRCDVHELDVSKMLEYFKDDSLVPKLFFNF